MNERVLEGVYELQRKELASQRLPIVNISPLLAISGIIPDVLFTKKTLLSKNSIPNGTSVSTLNTKIVLHKYRTGLDIPPKPT